MGMGVGREEAPSVREGRMRTYCKFCCIALIRVERILEQVKAATPANLCTHGYRG